MEELAATYYDPSQPGAYGGVQSLVRNTKASKYNNIAVKQWLSHQDTYTLHKPIRRRFKRRQVIVGGIDHQWQADLVDLIKLAKHNKAYKYLLTCIDVLSKYAWVVPLKNKTGDSLIKAFKSIFKQGRVPLCLQTDKGTEFTNRKFQAFLKQKGVRFFTTHNEETKASIAERFNRTLKTKMWRYFTKHNSYSYISIIKDLVKGYNHSYHRSIKRAPASVNLSNQEVVWNTLYGKRYDMKPPKFKRGHRVRISHVRRSLKKAYLANWSEELFSIHRVQTGIPNVYTLIDDNGDVLEGTFYEQELQRVGEKTWYRVEKVLKERKRRGRKEYFVKWFGYPTTFNSWVTDLDVYKN